MRIGMTFYRPRVALVCLVKIDGWFRAFDVFGIGREQLHGSGVAQLLPLAVDPSKIRAVRASRLAIFFDLNARVEGVDQSGRLAREQWIQKVATIRLDKHRRKEFRA